MNNAVFDDDDDDDDDDELHYCISENSIIFHTVVYSAQGHNNLLSSRKVKSHSNE